MVLVQHIKLVTMSSVAKMSIIEVKLSVGRESKIMNEHKDPTIKPT